MSESSVISQIHQTLDVQVDFPTQITFHLIYTLNRTTQTSNLVITQFRCLGVSVNTCGSKDLVRRWTADSIDVRQRNLNAFSSG